LVEIGSVVSEEKIFSKFHPPFSAHLAKGHVIGPVVSEEKIKVYDAWTDAK
jgi:hypothetical protein